MRAVAWGVLASSACAEDATPQKMTGLSCFGEDQDLTSASSKSYEDCASKCSANEDCTAFTFTGSKCELKEYCRNLQKERRSSSSVASGVFPSGRPAKFCSGKDMYLGKGYRCTDSTMQSLSVSDEGACCDKCQQTSGCGYYSYSTQQRTCELKATCKSKTKSSGWDTGFNPPAEPESFQYNVGQGSYNTPGFQCGNRDGTTLVFYPEGTGPFKIALYAHGLGGYLDHGTSSKMDGLDEWMKMVASTGFIVIVPFTGGGSCAKEYDDMLLALQYAQQNGKSLHPVFQNADWSGIGVWGHSMGAAAAPRIAEHSNEYGVNVTAMVVSHGGGTSTSLVSVPSMFTTGTLDTKDHDDDGNPNYFYSHYRVCRGRPKVFVNLQDGYHMEPLEGKRLNFLVAKFLACHVQGRQDYCNYIYGGEMCKRSDLAVCEIDTDPAPPSPPPTPRPTPAPTPPSPFPTPTHPRRRRSGPTPSPSPSPTPSPTNCKNARNQQACSGLGCQWCKSSHGRSRCKASCSFEAVV